MRKYKAVIAIAIVGIVLLALWWRFLRYGGDIREVANRVAIAVTGDSLARHSRSLAGWRAQNCGQVPTSGGNEHVTACATAAFRERRPFRVRFDIQGKDSVLSIGIVRDHSGEMYTLSQDDESGGASWRQNVRTIRCPHPITLNTTARGRLTCYPVQQAPYM